MREFRSFRVARPARSAGAGMPGAKPGAGGERSPPAAGGACAGAHGRRDPQALGADRPLPGCLPRCLSARAFCRLPAKKEAAASNWVAEISGGTQGPVASLPRCCSAATAMGGGLWATRRARPASLQAGDPALPPVPRPWPEQEGAGSGGAAEGLLSQATRGAGLRETGSLRGAGAQAAPCRAQGAVGPSCCPGGWEGRSEPSPYTNTDVTGGKRPE